ncbi:multisubunit Na+/H+ antiporter MnhB subunit [Paraburkholderia terricola]|nr:multisubunit Na+/H+ antiporter MnhB subunit [Paraburkholderia terricola]
MQSGTFELPASNTLTASAERRPRPAAFTVGLGKPAFRSCLRVMLAAVTMSVALSGCGVFCGGAGGSGGGFAGGCATGVRF